MNIAWLTDIHLNFLKVEARKKFYQQVIETGANKILITGDIAEAKDVCEILQEFSTYTNKLIYFVLGNHDYYLVVLIMYVKKFAVCVLRIRISFGWGSLKL